uniref:G-protein coupled receptors family 1 profile domain-containing protein n=1 Tax=Gorilla gorilla gorilla TaxID=9595 RepID=A0A2I2ZER3_GORGO
MRNHTTVANFILLGLTDDPQLQVIIFLLLFFTYMLSITGNLTIITLTLLDLHLKTPIMATGDKTISYNDCAAQLSRVCSLLVFASWMAGFLIIFPPLLMGLQLDFCAANTVDHFFYTDIIELMMLLSAILTLLVTLVLVILSYTNIIRTILKIPSSQQRKKAFSTCSSHMVVVSISYGSCIFMCVKPSAKERVSLNKGIALLSTSVAPMLNPFIYTLRNKQVKDVFKHIVKKIELFSMK